jgi:MoxR-like ATPase
LKLGFREGTVDRIAQLLEQLDREAYVADPGIATSLHLALELRKPLLVEGHAGVGKTEIAKVLARLLGTDLIRLQCYEGLDASTALYEWNYARQLLHIRLQERDGSAGADAEAQIFSEPFLLKRPLLQAIAHEGRPPVLLVDEIDRSDEEFEAFLLEVLSDFQVTVPEIGTIRARERPHVILTSNRSRELSDALRRRCLYLWIDYPPFEKELSIVRRKVPGASEELAAQIVGLVQRLRRAKLAKVPGVSETLDWAAALVVLHASHLTPEIVAETLGCLVKDESDLRKVRVDVEAGRLPAGAA